MIDQICFRFVFTGDPEEAERSKVLEKLREDLENKKYLVDQFFGDRKVGFVVEFRSSSGRVGVVRDPRQTTTFDVPLNDLLVAEGPAGQKMHIGFIRVADLNRMHRELGQRFFDSNRCSRWKELGYCRIGRECRRSSSNRCSRKFCFQRQSCLSHQLPRISKRTSIWGQIHRQKIGSF